MDWCRAKDWRSWCQGCTICKVIGSGWRWRVESGGGDRGAGMGGRGGGGEKLRICLLPLGREEREKEIDIENFSAFIMHMSRKRMPMENAKHKNKRFVFTFPQISSGNPVTRNRTRDHLIAAWIYSQMLYQLSYDRLENILALFVILQHLTLIMLTSIVVNRQGGGIEPLHVSMPHELKSCPSTSLTHPGIEWHEFNVWLLLQQWSIACVSRHHWNLTKALETGLEPAISSLGGRRLIH